MFRLITAFIGIALLCFGAIWLTNHPGDLTVDWYGYQLHTSFVLGVIIIAIAALVLLVVLRLLLALVRGPSDFLSFLSARQERKGLAALSDGMVAVAAGDIRVARKHAKSASKFLPEAPLTRLLIAQSAQLEGRDRDAAKSFEAMLADPKTEFLGLRGLFIQAKRLGNRDEAQTYAERAFARNSRTRWAAEALFELQAAEEDWVAALDTLDRAFDVKLLPRDLARRRRMIVLTAQALEAEMAARAQADEGADAAYQRALRLASEAMVIDPHFPPAVAIATRCHGALDQTRKGIRLVEDVWSHAPHPEVADAYEGLLLKESAVERLARIRTLAARRPEHIESRLMLARAAIATRDWASARLALRPYTDGSATQPATRRVCILIAAIEEGDQHDHIAARTWLARGLVAPEDPQWIGENYRSDRWSPINPMTGRLDELKWDAPPAKLKIAPWSRAGLPQSDGQTAAALAAVLNAAAISGIHHYQSPAAVAAGTSRDGDSMFQLPPLPDDPGIDHADEFGATDGHPQHRW